MKDKSFLYIIHTGIILLVLGIVFLAISMTVTSLVKSNEDIQMAESMFGAEITPANIESLMGMLEMFGEDVLDDTSKLGLQIYAKSEMLNMLGGIGIISGIALIVLDWRQKQNA